MAGAIQVGRVLFHGRGVLESGRSRHLWVYDQSADRFVLHAGPQHYGHARSRSTLRRVWNPRPRTALVLHESDAAAACLEHKAARLCVLGDQYRFADGDILKPSADRFAANVPIGFRRILVGPEL